MELIALSFRGNPENLIVYGDGSDGAANLTTGTTTLVRDMYYSNLTVAASVTLNTAGYRVFVRNILVNNGTIGNPGLVGGTGGGGGIGGVAGTGAPAGTLGGGDVGGNGYDEPFVGFPVGNSIGGSGGTGGGGGSTVTAPTATFGGPIPNKALNQALRGSHATNIRVVGGGGGSGGQNEVGVNGGGGGGGGGGVVMVSARKILGSGLFTAVGGAGGSPSGGTANPGAGGGGGGIILVYGKLDSTITTNVAGGAAGTGGSGSAVAGASGNLITVSNGLPR